MAPTLLKGGATRLSVRERGNGDQEAENEQEAEVHGGRRIEG
jgi:hypothetical protein